MNNLNISKLLFGELSGKQYYQKMLDYANFNPAYASSKMGNMKNHQSTNMSKEICKLENGRIVCCYDAELRNNPWKYFKA